MVLYRKYRPQTLEELIGQEVVKQTLKSAILNKKLSQAYLFCGPKGTGKTSTARILAKIINCEKYQQFKDEKDLLALPCNSCQSCISITSGNNLDVIEMDAASNRGIDDIRSLRENIKLSPVSSAFKVYIIDEAHMLSTEAFNALLKTLEEPPNHAIFILATTDPDKIPATILSRVQRLDFKLASVEELAQAIKQVAEKEKIKLTDEVVMVLAKKSLGSFRDAIKILEQISGQDGEDLKLVEENLGLSSFETIFKITQFLIEKSPQQAILALSESLNKGVPAKDINLGLLDLLRQMLLIKNNLAEQLVRPQLLAEEYQRLKSLADQVTTDKVVKVLDIFQKTLDQARFVSIPSLPLEVGIVESCFEEPVTAKPIVPQLAHEPTANIPDHISLETAAVSFKAEEDKPLSETSQPEMQKIIDRWPYILETVKQYNYSLEALLKSSEIAACEDGFVKIAVPYSFHQRILEASKSRDIIESVLADILGKSVRVATILKQKPVKKDDLANVEIAADDEIVRLASEIFNS